MSAATTTTSGPVALSYDAAFEALVALYTAQHHYHLMRKKGDPGLVEIAEQRLHPIDTAVRELQAGLGADYAAHRAAAAMVGAK